MEIFVLMLDTVAFGLLVLWALRGRGDAGLFGWRPPRPAPGPPAKRPARR